MSERTMRFSDGALTTWARPKFKLIRLKTSPIWHMPHAVVVRWNSFGGTTARPDISVVTMCGVRQLRPFEVETIKYPGSQQVCISCGRRAQKAARST